MSFTLYKSLPNSVNKKYGKEYGRILPVIKDKAGIQVDSLPCVADVRLTAVPRRSKIGIGG